MLNLRNVFELIIDRLNNCALTQQNLVNQLDQTVFHIFLALSNQLWTLFRELLKQLLGDIIPNHKSAATDRASRMEAQPTIEARTDLVISERRFLTKSRNSSMFFGKANRNPCVRYSQTRSIGFNWGECAGWNIKMILLGNRSLLARWQPAWSTYMRRRISLNIY